MAVKLAAVYGKCEAEFDTLSDVDEKLMAKAAAERRTGMVATLGGDERQAAELATLFGLQVATVNVAGQTVYGGPVDALQAFAAASPGGARVRRLQTAGRGREHG